MAGKSMFLNVITTLDGKGVKEATKDFKKLGDQFTKVSNNALKLGAAFAGLKVAQAGARFIGDSVEQARDLTRNLNGLSTVFEGVTPQMVEFAKNASNMGLSMNQAAKSSTFIGSVLKQSGFSIEETADLTERLVGLGTDLAITYGYDVQEALLGMTALFRGEYDPIEKFGVAMKQNEINAELARRKLDDLTGASRRLAEQQIRVEFLFDRAGDAVGQYAAQAGTLFAAQETLRAEFANLEAIVGYALTPAFAELALALRPLVVELAPVVIALFKSLIPVIESLTENKAKFVDTVIGAVQALVGLTKIMASVAMFVLNNIDLFRILAISIVGIQIGVGIAGALKGAMVLLTGAIAAAHGATAALNAQMLLLKARLIGTGIGAVIVALGSLAAIFMTTGDAAEDGTGDIKKYLDEAAEATLNLEENAFGATATLEGMTEGLDDVGASAGKAADAVGDFFNGLADDAAKLTARLELESLGASEGLIDKILGSGEDWYKVFESVTREGMQSVQNVQDMFLATATGFDEAMDAWQAEFDAFEEFEKSAIEARDALSTFVSEFAILPSIERQMGRFESATVDQLGNIEEKLKDAFDNGYLLDESYRNLLQYARDEFAVLQGIERQRDDLLSRRNAADALITSVQDSVKDSLRLTSLLSDVQDSAEQVDVVQFAMETVVAGDRLREFGTALITNFVEPIEEAKSKSQLLVDGFRGVVERTREYVDNLKALRTLGLDPQLFQQLVDAGVEAGGETARALIDGGAETINEVNSLFGELDALGAELGENTAQVMYGQGENFVNGIVEGLDSQISELETTANDLALSFTDTFEDVLIAGIEKAIAAAEAALARMPQVPGYTPPVVRDDDDGDGGDALAAQARTIEEIRKTNAFNLSPIAKNISTTTGKRETFFSGQQQFLNQMSGGDPTRGLPYTETKTIINVAGTVPTTREFLNLTGRTYSQAGSFSTGVRSIADRGV